MITSTTKKMSVAEFLKIKDNPVQRNTETHALRCNRPNGSLSVLAPTHHRVAIAQTKSGKSAWVLDGHTRRYLWERGELEQPSSLTCDIYTVKGVEEAIELFDMYDSQSSVKNSSDVLYGAFRYHKFQPHTTLFQQSGTLGAIKRLAFPTRWSDVRNLKITELVEPWIPTLRIIDNSAHSIRSPKLFPSWVMTAMLMTTRRDKAVAMSFWEAYGTNLGTKSQKSIDGIYALTMLRDYVKDNHHRTGNSLIAEFTPIAIELYEQWAKGKRLPLQGKGIARWGLHNAIQGPKLSNWWQESLGDYDYPQIRKQGKLLDEP